MLFPSEVFLFVFLPLVLAVYYIFLRKTKELKNIFLLAASLFFRTLVHRKPHGARIGKSSLSRVSVPLMCITISRPSL